MKKNAAIFIALTLILLVACGSAPEQIEPTADVEPSAQPSATSTPKPTQTPVPPTPTVAVPEGMASYFEGTEIDFYDPFDSNNGWGIGCGCTISNGVFVAIGNQWSGASWDEGKLEEGEGVLLDFSFTKDSEFEVYVNVGDWPTENYRRFGLYVFNNSPHANLWAGGQLFSGRLVGNLKLQPDTTYTVALMIGEGGEFGAIVWDPADPSQLVSTHETLGTSWADRSWGLAIGGNAGQITYDNLRFVSFSGFVP